MVELCLEFSLQEWASLFCLADPLAVGVAKIEADIDHVSIILQLVRIQVHQFYLNAEVSILINSFREGVRKYKSILIGACSKQSNC